MFNGKIIVRADAQKTDAKQTNKALLLSDDANINTKPELEIFANDVKFSTVPPSVVDEDAMFYLEPEGWAYRKHARCWCVRLRRHPETREESPRCAGISKKS